MNESDARSALMVRAYETLPPAQLSSHWTAVDRGWATQAALQVEGEKASAEAFIQRRARLASERICERDHGAHRLLRALTWRPWIGWVLAILAFVAGIATDALASSRQINVLAPPLLALLAWNFAVYAVLLVRAAMRIVGKRSEQADVLTRQIARVAHAAVASRRIAGLAPPLAGFARAWNAASMPLTLARVGRTLHVAAMAFAVGALLGIYLRGFALEYRAGWESTFLAAPAVHAILSFVLGPASAATGIVVPDVAGVAAIHFAVSPGENAARWIHLYAVTVALCVLLPRALMAVVEGLRERRLVSHFPLSLEDGYFQAMMRTQRDEAVSVHVVPYDYHPGAQRTSAMQTLTANAFGPRATVSTAPSVPYGGEDTLDPDVLPAAPASLVVALFPLTATPERENHLVFVDALRARLPPSTALAWWVDESGFRQRFDEARLEERRAAWRRLFAHSGGEPLFIDLDQADLNAAGQALRSAYDQAGTHATYATHATDD